MTRLGPSDVNVWCAGRSLNFTRRRMLAFSAGNGNSIGVNIEAMPAARVIALAEQLAPTWPGSEFGGALLWIRERGIWGDFSEAIGSKILQLLSGGAELPQDGPGFLFNASEVTELHAFGLVPLLFGWDAFIVPEGAGFFAFASHDGYLSIVFPPGGDAEPWLTRLAPWRPSFDASRYDELL